MSKGKVTSFVTEVLARVKGDTATVVAEKNYRKASAGIQGQIASLKSKQMDEEQKVEDALEALNNAKYPVEIITDVTSYISNIKSKQNSYNAAKEALDDVNHSLTYYTELLEGFEKEVPTIEKA